jgi:deferrochelatase/peroxidase EfeB
MGRRTIALPAEDARDIQGLAWSGFGRLRGARYLLLRVEAPAPARAWLRGLPVQTVADALDHDLDSVTQMAFTASGLRALGVAPEIVDAFAPEFAEGMAGDASRSRRLGDIAGDAPSHWDWGSGAREPHVGVLLYASPEQIAALAAQVEGAARSAGLSTVAALDTNYMGGFEPFGFRDGISQPTVDWDQRRTPNTDDDMGFHNIIALGEVLLGYRNEYALYTERPMLDADVTGTADLPWAEDSSGRRDLGRNGTYLVVRQLRQDVRGFWRWLQETAGEVQGQTGALGLAEAMVGRHRSGEPFAELGTTEIPGIEAQDRRLNGFTYGNDPNGRVCPFGGHVRRANPRTGDFPDGRTGWIGKLLASLGLIGSARGDRIASSRFHRLVRRGREYGTWLDPADAAKPDASDPQSGIHFMCLNANLARQFEFVQGAWLQNAKFGGLTGESDPLLGNRHPFPPGQATDRFVRPRAEGSCQVAEAVPQFVTVRGGAYFFLPGLRARAWFLADR